MTQKSRERRALIISAFINLMMTAAGLWIFSVTGIQALFLDFFFSFIAALSAITAIVISKVSTKITTHYPNGIYFLEPFYAISKSLLTLFLLAISVFSTTASAYAYFIQGVGEPMKISSVLPYSFAMVILCFGLGFFNKHQNKRMNNASAILTAESKSNFIDGILSLGVGIAVIPLHLTPLDSAWGFLHYTGDFFITTVLVLFSVKEPIKVLISSFRELSGGTTTDKVITKNIHSIAKKHLSMITERFECNIYKIGMHFKVQICLHMEKIEMETLELVRKQISNDLYAIYENTEVTFTI